MDLRILPAVEGGEVKAEGRDAHQQALDELHAGLRPAVLVQAGCDEPQVSLELPGPLVSLLVRGAGGTEARVDAL